MGSLGIVPNLGQIYNPDSFTGNGSNTTFTLTHLVTSDQSIIWVEGGVVQKPGIDFTISGLTLTRTTAPVNLVACFAMYLGVSLDIGTPSDGTVTLAKMAVNSVDSDQYVDGSIDEVHMSANSIDSDSYVDGSIDEAHIANDAVNFATHLKAGTDGELITWDASGNPAAVPVGAATHVLTSGGTGVAPTFQAASGGDLRNFIIDGDFTQWPAGTVTIPTTAYGPALWEGARGTSLVFDMIEETSVLPTIAQSGHQSASCFKLDVTTADASLAANDQQRLMYKMTGSDFAYLHQQQVTFSFWVRSTITGTFCVSFMNSANDRSYVATYTVSSSNTWEKKTITLTLDTSGTWLFTEADIGLRITFCFMAGTDLHGTANTWGAGEKYGVSGMANGVNDAANNIYISQVGLYLGSTAPTFLGESVATTINQVEYYIERSDYITVGNEMTGYNGYQGSTTVAYINYAFRNKKRVAPTISASAFGTFYIGYENSIATPTAYSLNPNGGIYSNRIQFTTGAIGAARAGITLLRKTTSAGCFIQADSRH